MRFFFPALLVEPGAGAGDVEGFEIGAAEGTRGNGAGGQVDLVDLIAGVGIVAGDAVAAPLGNPEVALVIHGHAVGHSGILGDPDRDAGLGDDAGIVVVGVGIDALGWGIDVIKGRGIEAPA